MYIIGMGAVHKERAERFNLCDLKTEQENIEEDAPGRHMLNYSHVYNRLNFTWRPGLWGESDSA